jgi:hypothetical protein
LRGRLFLGTASVRWRRCPPGKLPAVKPTQLGPRDERIGGPANLAADIGDRTDPINKRVWESFDASDRQVIEDATAAEYTRSLAEFNANNALWLRKLRDEGTVKILKFDDPVLKEFFRISKDVVAGAGSGDDLSKKIYASYQQFFALIIDWSDLAEGAVLQSRRLA